MRSQEMPKAAAIFLKALAGVLIGSIGTAALIWRQLLPFTPHTRGPLVGGGLFGLLAGTLLGLLFPVKDIPKVSVRVAVPCAAGVAGVVCLMGEQAIVRGEMDFPLRQLVMALLAFVVLGTLYYISTAIAVSLSYRKSDKDS